MTSPRERLTSNAIRQPIECFEQDTDNVRANSVSDLSSLLRSTGMKRLLSWLPSIGPEATDGHP